MTAEEKKAFLASLAGMFQGANMQNAQVNMFVESGAKVVYKEVTTSRNEESDRQHFPPNRNESEGRQWYEFLMKQGFIGSETTLPCWMFLMGFSTVQPEEVKPIAWLKTVETARLMLRKVHGNLIDARRLTVSRMEELASQCFTKQGVPLKLAKPKKEYSQDADAIENFLPTVSDQ